MSQLANLQTYLPTAHYRLSVDTESLAARVIIRLHRLNFIMSEASIKTRVLIISDTHCAGLSKHGHAQPRPPFIFPLPKADVLIHCGDLTHEGTIEQYNRTLNMLKEIDAPVKLVIAGNHDLTLDREFVMGHLKRDKLTKEEGESRWQQARALWTAPNGRAVLEGVTFLDEGHHQITLPNGAKLKVYATPYTPEFYDWGFPYERDVDRFNPASFVLADAKNDASAPVESFLNNQTPIDILVSHGPSWGRLDVTDRGISAGCPHLLRAVARARPLIHCFGHIHEGWGAEKVRWSHDVDSILATGHGLSTSDWNSEGWKQCIADQGQAIDEIEVDLEAAKTEHAVFADISSTGAHAIERGKDTLLVNAAIMDVKYHPVNAPCKSTLFLKCRECTLH